MTINGSSTYPTIEIIIPERPFTIKSLKYKYFPDSRHARIGEISHLPSLGPWRENFFGKYSIVALGSLKVIENEPNYCWICYIDPTGTKSSLFVGLNDPLYSRFQFGLILNP